MEGQEAFHPLREEEGPRGKGGRVASAGTPVVRPAWLARRSGWRLAAAAAALAVALAGLALGASRVPPGGLLKSDLPDFERRLGRFTVAWSRGDARLTVLHTKRWCMWNCTREVWATRRGLAWVEAAEGHVSFDEPMAGHYLVRQNERMHTVLQTLDSVEYAHDRSELVLKGVLVKEYSIVRALWHELQKAGWSLRGLRHLQFDSKAKDIVHTRYEFTFKALGRNRLGFEVEWDTPVFPRARRAGAARRRFNLVSLFYESDPRERFYGLGAQCSSINHAGKRVPILASEQGIGRGLQPLSWTLNRALFGVGGRWWYSYTAVPHYVSSLSRSLFIADHTYMEFDFVYSSTGTVGVHVLANAGSVAGQILAGDTPLEVIEAYTEYAGRMPPLPAWAYRHGAVVALTGGTEAVRSRVRTLRDAGVPVAGVWLQDWTGVRDTAFAERLWWNWELDMQHYNDWGALLRELRANDTRILTYINPFLMAHKGPKGRYHREAASLGYLVRSPRGSGEQPRSFNQEVRFGLLDLSNRDAVEWTEKILLENLLFAGGMGDDGRPLVSGWMADFGEYLPFDAALASGEDAVAVHNRYPEEWAALNRRVLSAAGLDGEGVFFTRSASIRTPAHSPLMWMGDQLVSWDAHDGIKSALLGMLQAGLSGFALSHSDIGGYTATPTHVRSPQLLMRWIELSALADSMFRTHQGNRPLRNAQVWDSPELLAFFAHFARVHAAFGPYRAQLMHEAASTGAPLTRAMFLHYPHDKRASSLVHQFLVGSEFLAAPALDLNATRVHVYLPPGSAWSDVWTGAPSPLQPSRTDGVWVTVETPLGYPALFIRTSASTIAAQVAETLRFLSADFLGGPFNRTIVPMDSIDKLVLGYLDFPNL